MAKEPVKKSAKAKPTAARKTKATGAAILAIGAYVPRTRIERRTIAEMWSGPVVPGERSLAAADEDAVTMAVQAGSTCLAGRDRTQVDAVYLASTSAPYGERQGAVIIAGALDLRKDVATIDFGDSLRAGTSALRAARDAVVAGAAKQILVIASDRRMAEPESPFEQIYGDGAAAVLVGPDGADVVASIDTIVSLADDVTMGWRRAEDRFVRSYNPKHEIDFGYTDQLKTALTAAIAESGVDAATARLAIPSPDGRAQFKVAKAVGVSADKVADPLVLAIGILGTPAPFLALIGALDAAAAGDTILLAAAGEGADAVVLHVRAGLPADAWRPAQILEDRRVVPSYGDFVRANKLIDLPGPAIFSSPVTVWRDRRQDLNLYGMRCTNCGLVQYPIGRICQKCKAKDQRQEIPLSKNGTIFTYTLDHVVAATYSTIPVVRAIIDLEGGARFLSAVTDIEPSDAFVGMPVELVFRRMNDGGGFKNYFWKARPVAGAAKAKEGAA